MDTHFCNLLNNKYRIIKCMSIEDKITTIFIPLYFLENDFNKNDEITWFSNKIRGYGTVLTKENDHIIIKNKDDSSTMKIPRPYVNKLNPLHITINKLQENINTKNIFKNIKDDEIKNLLSFLNIPKKDLINELFPLIKDGYQSKFIFDIAINEDDTNEIVLTKISQRCHSNNFESYKYIFASYIDINTNQQKPLGFNYINQNILSPNTIITKNICELLELEINFTDEQENNNIHHIDESLLLFENNKIKDNIIYFIGLNKLITNNKLLSLIDQGNIDCDTINYELLPFKNRIIHKYWPFLKKKDI